MAEETKRPEKTPAERAKNIFQRMDAVTAELQTVGKNLTVTTGKSSSYKAVSERDIIDAVKPAEHKHGVYSFPAAREIIEAQTLESEGFDGKKKTTFYARISTTYRFVNVDEPWDYIEMTTFADGIDSGDKGCGKAMTYADKYALMKAYKISTGDDPDEKASDEVQYKRTPKPRAQAENLPSPRDRLLALLTALGIDIRAYAAENGLNKTTTDDKYNELIKNLEAENGRKENAEAVNT